MLCVFSETSRTTESKAAPFIDQRVIQLALHCPAKRACMVASLIVAQGACCFSACYECI